MKASQKTQLKVSEVRQKLNKALQDRNALPDGQQPTTEQVSELESMTTELGNLEVEFRAQVVSEDQEETEQRAKDPDAESKERDKILAKATLLPFVMEAVSQKELGDATAESELRSAVLGDEARAGLVPFEMLDRKVEHRVDAVTPLVAAATADGSQATMLERVFSRSIAARLRVSMPSVPVGAANYPVMLTGTGADMRAADGEQDAEAGSFTGFTLDPVRLSARYLFRIEDVYKLRGFEDVLRRDLTAVMTDEMDDQIVNGTGAAPQVSGFVTELDAVAAGAAVTTWKQFIAAFTGLVDGKNAYTLGDIRSVIGSDTFVYAETLYRANQSDMSAQEYIASRTGGMSVSSRIASGDVQNGIAALTSYPGRNAVAPVWRAMEVIRDNITGAAKGQIALTAIMLWNFKILRETGFSLFKIRNMA